MDQTSFVGLVGLFAASISATALYKLSTGLGMAPRVAVVIFAFAISFLAFTFITYFAVSFIGRNLDNTE